MLIGIDASHANKIQRTGVEEYCWQIIQNLKKIIPSTVRVVLYSPTVLFPELADLPTNWEVKVLAWPLKKLWSQIPLAYELWKNPPDIYFSPGQLLPWLAPKNSVVMVHDSAFEAYPDAYRFFSRLYLRWMNKIIVQKADKILVSADFNKQELEKYYGRVENIFITPLAYDSTKYNVAGNKKTDLGKYILSIGRLETKKNTARLVVAFTEIKKQLPDLKLVLIGTPGAGYEEIEQAIEQSPNKKDIILPGFVRSEEVAEYLRGAAAFVFPSLYEGFGIPILEAMACGTAVVASRGSGLDEVGGAAVEYVDSLSTNDIADKILKLLQDEDYKKQKIAQGLERVKNFSWEQAARATSEILLNKKTG